MSLKKLSEPVRRSKTQPIEGVTTQSRVAKMASLTEVEQTAMKLEREISRQQETIDELREKYESNVHARIELEKKYKNLQEQIEEYKAEHQHDLNHIAEERRIADQRWSQLNAANSRIDDLETELAEAQHINDSFFYIIAKYICRNINFTKQNV